MKHFYIVLSFAIIVAFDVPEMQAQDAGVISISPPINVCNNNIPQNVTITIKNYSTSDIINAVFTNTFQVDGGTIVSEVANLSIDSGEVTTYTFNAQTPSIAIGSHTIIACSDNPLDITDGNNCDTLSYSNYPETVGGSVTSSATVCSGANGATLTLAGYTGSILNWESSTDGGSSWSSIANTTNTQSYSNITTTTIYRAIVKSGVCLSVASSGATITVDPVSNGGTFGSATVCAGANSGVVTLGGNTGNVLNWESSIDGGGSWTAIANTSTSQNYLNLTVTTLYRAVVQSGVCASANSIITTITVDPATVGGAVTSSATVCSGANGATLTLAGHTGNVLNWESSTDGGINWTTIANINNTYAYSNITATTVYRAIVKSGVCNSIPSLPATITVDPPTVAGTVSTSVTVCSGANSGTLSLSGHTGSILNWESSIDAGANWTAIANTSTSQSYLNITATTMYRAVVQSGVCPPLNSAPATITVDPASVGGAVTTSATECSGANGATLTLAGHTGNVLNWESSIDGGATWNNIVNTTTTQAYTNLTTETIYRAIVKSGVCNSVESAAAVISIYPVTVPGTVGTSASVCSGANSGTLTLTGHTGNILNWESSTDGVIWTGIANTSTSQGFLNLTATTMYRAVVQSGVCPSLNSAVATITVDPVTIGGTVNSNTVECSGSNNGTLTLSGHTGSILNWEISDDGGLTWSTVSNTTTTQGYLNLTNTRVYRAVVMSGSCPSVPSAPATITVDTLTIGGSVGSSATVCSGENNGTLTLTGHTGNVLNWEYSIDGVTWTADLSNTSTTQDYLNLTVTTMYRAIVKSGTCNPVASGAATITINSSSAAGAIFNDAMVCTGVNSGVLTLNGFSGSVINWEFSIDGGAGWTTIVNATATQNYANLTSTTLYRAKVQNCSVMYSTIATIAISPQPVAEFSVPVLMAGAPATFTNTSSISNGYIAQYFWNFGDSNIISLIHPMHTFMSAGTYVVSLTVVSDNGCAHTDSATVTVTEDPNSEFIISNLLTLNGNGENDTWYIQDIEKHVASEVMIYNRYGHEIYKSSPYLNNWDGTHNGTRLPDGTYYYVLKLNDPLNRVFKGAITIIR